MCARSSKPNLTGVEDGWQALRRYQLALNIPVPFDGEGLGQGHSMLAVTTPTNVIPVLVTGTHRAQISNLEAVVSWIPAINAGMTVSFVARERENSMALGARA